jgi:Fic family protein
MVTIQTAPDLQTLIAETAGDRLMQILTHQRQPTVNGRYRHWDDVRHRQPPGGLTAREWWLGIKLARSALMHPLPLRDRDRHQFSYSMPDEASRMVHQIDQRASGEIAISEEVTNSATRDRYIVNSLIEEAITSSQLEGASTTHRVAKEMLRSGRPPRTRDERMILNNFRAMNMVRGWGETPLTPELVLDLHRVVTEGTLDNPDAAGRVQRPDEERVHVQDPDGVVVFVPPPAEELPDRLEAMCRFANGEGVEGFLHPVVRAILVHFWLAHDHPFEDGNGRTARALFYWSMLSQGYWLTEFLSISRILRNAPMQYGRSFLYTEHDERDTTYFILYQLRVILRAIDDLHEYLRRKMEEIRDSERVLRSAGLNHRQRELISHALRHPFADYTFKSHGRSHGVVYQSARTDLLDLEGRGLLERRIIGQAYHFRPVADLVSRLEKFAA